MPDLAVSVSIINSTNLIHFIGCGLYLSGYQVTGVLVVLLSFKILRRKLCVLLTHFCPTKDYYGVFAINLVHKKPKTAKNALKHSLLLICEAAIVSIFAVNWLYNCRREFVVNLSIV